jgi:hypothetical protein
MVRSAVTGLAPADLRVAGGLGMAGELSIWCPLASLPITP